jgi:hypothetical protein
VGADPVSHTVSWTVPEATMAKAYFRVRVTTPPGACDSEDEASWTFSLLSTASGAGGTASSESFNGTIFPGTKWMPVAGGYSFGGGHEGMLLPGDYSVSTEVTRAEFVPACADTIVETEVFVIQEASIA